MSELASVTTVPPAGADEPSVTVHVAESPLPPAMIDGLHVNELAVCAYALGASSVHVIRQMPRANAECFVEIGRSTRLNSSHLVISYAVFCLKKKKKVVNTSRR